MDSGSANVLGGTWGEDDRLDGLGGVGPPATATQPRSLESLLETARSLADGLAHAPVSGKRNADALRIARALMLDVVDLLEATAPR